MSNKALPATVAAPLAINSFTDLQRMAKLLLTSGVFGPSGGEQELALAATKILAGQELGIPPFAAMKNIHLVKGKAFLGYQIVGMLIKNSGKYDYRVKRLDAEGCVIEFYQGQRLLGENSFTKQDAAQAGLLNNDNYKKNPRNMFFARALTNGANFFCPDVFGGAGVEAEVEAEAIDDVTPPQQSQALALPPPVEADDAGGVDVQGGAQVTETTLPGSTPGPATDTSEGSAPW